MSIINKRKILEKDTKNVFLCIFTRVEHTSNMIWKENFKSCTGVCSLKQSIFSYFYRSLKERVSKSLILLSRFFLVVLIDL